MSCYIMSQLVVSVKHTAWSITFSCPWTNRNHEIFAVGLYLPTPPPFLYWIKNIVLDDLQMKNLYQSKSEKEVLMVVI